MDKPVRLVFLQRRSHKAGAQTCLARLVRHPALRPFSPLVICGEPGWLPEELKAHGVGVRIEPFPTARSLAGRLLLNRLFCRRLAADLADPGASYVIHGNDHQEAPLTLALGRALGARTALFLRSPSMSREDYRKYRCADADLLTTVGDELLDKLAAWDPGRPVPIISDGIYTEELASALPAVPDRPRRFLVLGSPLPWKGWRDLVDALVLLAERGEFPANASFDFTGSPPGDDNPLGLDRLPGGCCRFLGRRTDFPQLATDYDFVINPSRHETFGMAAIEVVALGLPLLSSDSGIIDRVIDLPDLLYPAGDASRLSLRLAAILGGVVPTSVDRKRFQEAIRVNFLIDRSAEALLTAYAETFGWSPRGSFRSTAAGLKDSKESHS